MRAGEALINKDLLLLGVVIEGVVVVPPGAVVMVVQQPSIGGVPDLEVRRCPKDQHHHHDDRYGYGHDAACTQGMWDLFYGDTSRGSAFAFFSHAFGGAGHSL